jgi:hypothetical protein
VLDPANPKLVNLIPTAAYTTPASLHVLVGVDVKNLLFFVADEGVKQSRAFVSGKPFQMNLMLAINARAQSPRGRFRLRQPSGLTNIRPGVEDIKLLA